MDKLVQADFDELRRPNTFYCTFENIKACQLLIRNGKVKAGEHVLKVKRAKDPTDILVENRGLRKRWRVCRAACLLGILFPMILSGTYVIYVKLFDYQQLINYSINIPGANSANVETRFPGENLTKMAFLEELYYDLNDFSKHDF